MDGNDKISTLVVLAYKTTREELSDRGFDMETLRCPTVQLSVIESATSDDIYIGKIVARLPEEGGGILLDFPSAVPTSNRLRAVGLIGVGELSLVRAYLVGEKA